MVSERLGQTSGKEYRPQDAVLAGVMGQPITTDHGVWVAREAAEWFAAQEVLDDDALEAAVGIRTPCMVLDLGPRHGGDTTWVGADWELLHRYDPELEPDEHLRAITSHKLAAERGINQLPEGIPVWAQNHLQLGPLPVLVVVSRFVVACYELVSVSMTARGPEAMLSDPADWADRVQGRHLRVTLIGNSAAIQWSHPVNWPTGRGPRRAKRRELIAAGITPGPARTWPPGDRAPSVINRPGGDWSWLTRPREGLSDKDFRALHGAGGEPPADPEAELNNPQ